MSLIYLTVGSDGKSNTKTFSSSDALSFQKIFLHSLLLFAPSFFLIEDATCKQQKNLAISFFKSTEFLLLHSQSDETL